MCNTIRTTPRLPYAVAAGLLLAACAFAQRADIGMNLGMPWYDYDGLKVFADAVKQARGFIGYDPDDANNNNLPVATDADGWPLDDAMLVMFHGASRMNGSYRLCFTTQNPSVDARTVSVQYAWTTATPGSQVYDAATNTVRCDVAVAGNQLKLIFANTRGGVRNVKFMRPITFNGSTPYDTTVLFTTPALELCGKFGALRFMQVGNALSDNMVVNWADRTKPTYCCQQSRGFGGEGSAGVAYEYMAALCNAVDADLYVCVPFLATDAYVDSLATLLKNTLEPDRRIYVEYSNELWNGNQEYDMHRNHDSAMAEVGRGGSPLAFDGSDGEWTWAWRRAGKRGVEISKVFRRVFGDAAMMTRVRPLLMTQTGDAQATLTENLIMLLDYYNNPAHVADPHPPRYYFYGAGGAGYYGPRGTYDISNIWSSGSMAVSGFVGDLLPDIRLCATFGLRRVAYEAGPGFDEQNAAEVAAWHDSRLTRTMIEHHDTWSNYGGDLCAYFTLTGWGSTDLRHTFLTDVDSAHTPKMNAIDSLNARSAAAVTFGTLPPCSIDGDSAAARFTPLWDPPSACRPTEWFSYIIRVEQPGTYGVTVDYTASATGAVALLADGQEVGAPSLTSGTHTTAKVTAYFEPGLHGIIVRVASLAGGRLSINQVNVSVESLASQPMRAAAIGPRPSLRSVNGRLTVRPGRGGWAEVCTLDGRVLWRGEAQAMTSLTPGSGVFLLRTQGARGAAVVAR